MYLRWNVHTLILRPVLITRAVHRLISDSY